ncbi:hypothetical protein D049_0473A, partial [Vibrio parahaemolyticus VPTS-2010]
MVAAHLRPNA